MLREVRIRLLTCVVLAALGAVAAGCGGGSGTVTVVAHHPRTTTGAAPAGPAAPHAPSAADVAVVRRWADAVRLGDVPAAVRAFRVPATIANGGPPITVRSRDGIRVFNETLPCGAKVVDAKPAPLGYFVVTFLLVDRRGSRNCGAGVGQLARTAIRLRHGRITDWVRVQDVPRGPSISA
jgi:hypothetical protein